VRRIYLRPCGFVDTPVGFDGQVARLAGTMQYFSALELIETKSGKRIARTLVPLADLDSRLAGLPDDLEQRARSQFANIVSPRRPLAMGDRNIPLDQPRVMAILNCTPDSFSDGGKHGEDPDSVAETVPAHRWCGRGMR
jgi:dihydropteroate synthase